MSVCEVRTRVWCEKERNRRKVERPDTIPDALQNSDGDNNRVMWKTV